ncbi:MAG: family 16 glycoside hydrolase [Bryobacteraceae bacterium]
MRKRSAILLGAQLLTVGQTMTFDRQRAGTALKGWTIGMTHDGGAPKWEVIADPSAPSGPNVLAQTSTDNTSGRFPLAIYDGATFANGAVSVRFKPVSGARDQAAGLVWRYKDVDNYYIVRANALEDNVVLYKVEAGQRISLEPKGTPSKTYGVKRKVPRQAWSALQVRFSGPRFAVYFDGERIMDVEDATFTEAGKAGLWTKADSVIHFDDFWLEREK